MSYDPPGGYETGGFPPPYSGPPPAQKSGMVGQVPVVSILMIVFGSMYSLMGILLAMCGPAMIAYFHSIEGQSRTSSDTNAMYAIGGVYLVLGICNLVAGVLNIFAGIKNLKYRSRTFGIVSLAVGMLACTSCYCSPFALGLLIYGLIVYMNGSVRQAFQLGEEGLTPEEIKARL